jgi:hypothetical protein
MSFAIVTLINKHWRKSSSDDKLLLSSDSRELVIIIFNLVRLLGCLSLLGLAAAVKMLGVHVNEQTFVGIEWFSLAECLIFVSISRSSSMMYSKLMGITTSYTAPFLLRSSYLDDA